MTTTLDPNHTATLTKLAELQARINDLTSEAETLKARLRDLPPGQYAVNGRPALRITPTVRFDANAAAQALDPDTRKTCLTVTYDPALVKQHLTPAQVTRFMVESGKPRVVIL